MHTLLYEFRYALRQLSKAPGFAAVSVLTLALGIGANIAVFSVTNAVLLNPSGIPHATGLVALRARYGAMPDLSNINMSAPDFGDAAAGKNIFSSAAVLFGVSFNYARENGNPELLNGAQVSSGYFETFDVRPHLGRVFTPEEDQPGAGNEAVLAYRTWQKHFGSNPNIVGQTLTLNNQAYRVVGVMGPSFDWPNPVELWVPIAFPLARYHDANYRYNENLLAIARLRPGVTLQQANAYLNRKAEENIASEGSKSFGRASGWGMFAMPLTEFIGGNLRKPLTMLLIAVGMVLLIACANIAGLQMARGNAIWPSASLWERNASACCDRRWLRALCSPSPGACLDSWSRWRLRHYCCAHCPTRSARSFSLRSADRCCCLSLASQCCVRCYAGWFRRGNVRSQVGSTLFRKAAAPASVALCASVRARRW